MVNASRRESDAPGVSATGGELLALLFSLLWGVFGFGLIDLETALPPGDPEFRTRWFLEGSWGVFVTALVIVPLLVVVLSPHRVFATVRQLHVVAVCAAAAAVLCLDPQLLTLPVALEATAWAVWAALRGPATVVPGRVAPGGEWAGQRWPVVLVLGVYGVLPLLFGLETYTVSLASALVAVMGLSLWLAYSPEPPGNLRPGRPRAVLLGVASLVWAAGWGWYAVSMATKSWAGVEYRGTVDRISAQSGFALAVAALPLVASLGWLPVREAVWTACVAGAGLGSFAILYPNQLASPGETWGVAAVVCSIVAIALAEATLRRTRATRQGRTPV
jgi:hypothetical protein